MAKQSTMIHLEAEQKSALQKRARQRGSSMAAEIRNAVDQYLAGASVEEMVALEVLSKSAEKELERMSRRLDQANAKLDRVFKTMARLQKQKAAA